MEFEDESLVQDFKDEFNEAFEAIQKTLIQLEHQPEDSDLLNELFRRMHSVKGNLRMMGLNMLSDFIHVAEEILDDLRKGQYQFAEQLSDVFILCLEKIQKDFLRAFAGGSIDESALINLADGLNLIRHSQARDSNHINHVLSLLDPHFIVENTHAVQDLNEVNFFARLCDFVDQRVFGSKNRHQKVLELCTEMNQLAGTPVNEMQLEVAVYMHDFAMALLPNEVLNRKGKLSDDELAELRTHPITSAALLTHMEEWHEAMQIVLQHHERADGNGYPKGLNDEQICDGAKILAIADTYESMTNLRADRDYKRSILRVVSEINANSGTQFSSAWVEIFNQLIRQRHLKRA